MCLFSKCFNYFKNKQPNISHSREINTHIIPHNTNNTNNTHIINHDSEQESITESITESIQQNIIIFNTNTIIKSDDIRIPEPINDIHTHEQILINTPIQLVQHNDNNNDNDDNDNNDNNEQYNIIYNQDTNIQKDTAQDNCLTTLDVYNISMNNDYEYSSDTDEYIKVLESIIIPYTQ